MQTKIVTVIIVVCLFCFFTEFTQSQQRFLIGSSIGGTSGEMSSPTYSVTFSAGTLVSGEMSSQNYNCSNGPMPITTIVNSFSKTISVQKRWNLISVPLMVNTTTKSTLFPTSISSAFAFAGSYVNEDSLVHGKGYWLKFGEEQDITILGGPLLSELFVNVNQGWNLIGSVSEPLDVASIGSDPGGIITSNFFGYNNSYFAANTIQPGKGYWVKVNQAGSLILSSSGQINQANRIRIIPTGEKPPSSPNYMESEHTAVPKEYALYDAFPSPFNPSTTIKYQLPVDSKISLIVYNMVGQTVSVLSNEQQPAGYKSIEWHAGNFASGVYLFRLEAVDVNNPANSFTQVKKMLLLK